MSYTFGDVENCKVANGQTRKEYECRLGYEVNSQSIEDNTSTVTLLLQARSINSSYKTKGNGQTPTIDGMTLSKRTIDMSDTNEWQDLGSRTVTISHNADGSCSVNKTGSFVCTAGSSNYSLRSGSASVTVEPEDIPRASQPSCVTWPKTTQNVGDIGGKFTIHMNRVSNSFIHTVRYVWAGKKGTIATGVTTNVEWTIPMDFCNDIGSSTSGTGTIYVDTYSGSECIGTKSVSFTANVPSSVIPSISSVEISEGNSSVGVNVYVQNKSQLRVITNANGSYGSWITSCKITGIDNNTYWGTDITSGILIGSGTKTITITVTDSRGRTLSTTKTYSCVAYSNPQIISVSAVRCDSDGTENDDGENIKYSFKGAISPIENKNTKTYKIGYKHSTENSYTYITIDNDAYLIDKSDIIIPDVVFSNNNSYDIQFLIQDKYISVTQNIPIGTGKVLLNFHKSGKAMALGKKSEAGYNEELLEIELPTIIKKLLFKKITNAKSEIEMNYDDCIVRVKEIETDNELKFGIEANGRGIWDKKRNKWILNIDDDNVYIDDINANKIQIKPIIAYSNESGTTGTITLSEDASKYKYMRVSYLYEGNEFSSNTFSNIDNIGGYYWLSCASSANEDNYNYIHHCLLNVNGKTVTLSRNNAVGLNKETDAIYTPSGDNNIYVQKIELWN